MAGSLVGETCFLKADSDAERLVQSVCGQRTVCRVEAMVRAADPGAIVKVLGVRQVAMAPAETSSYLERVARRLDGVLAPRARAATIPRTRPTTGSPCCSTA